MTKNLQLKHYLVDGFAGWYIVKAYSMNDARRDGNKEFGRGHVKSVTRATDSDIKYFKSLKGEISEAE